MLPATLVTLLEQLASKAGNVKFALFGDWNQLLPPMNRWRRSPVPEDAFQHSRLFHYWADGAEFRLTRCRRAQREYFDVCQGLLESSLADAVQRCRSLYPPAEGVPLHMQGEKHLTLSHRRRIQLNRLCQEAAVRQYRLENPDGRVVAITPTDERDAEEHSLNRAQPFELYEGTRLVGANNETKGINNGVFMVVGQVREEECDVTDEFGTTCVLSFKAILASTRLAWAITVTSSQSREFNCAVVLWDLGSPFYTLRHLYVAMTRVRRPETLVVVP
jgi:hypothetical protein